MKGACARIIQVLNEADYKEGKVPRFDTEALSHLDNCPTCREEYRVFSEARELFAALLPIEPDPLFGSAWRERLREARSQDEAGVGSTARERSFVKTSASRQKRPWIGFNFPLFRNWQLAAGLSTAVIILLFSFGFARQWQLPSNPNNSNREIVGHSGEAPGDQSAAFVAARYQLRILKIGSHSKQVQRIIRDYRRSAEGGASYAFRDPEAGLAFHGLTMLQARNLKEELVKVGAEVEYVKEK